MSKKFIILIVILVIAIIGFVAVTRIAKNQTYLVSNMPDVNSGWVTTNPKIAEDSIDNDWVLPVNEDVPHSVSSNDKYLESIYNIFDNWNKCLFNNVLKVDGIYIHTFSGNVKSYWAYTEKTGDNKISIHFADDFIYRLNDWSVIEATLLHEMVHVYIYQFNIEDDYEHGAKFHEIYGGLINNILNKYDIKVPSYEETLAFNLCRMYYSTYDNYSNR